MTQAKGKKFEVNSDEDGNPTRSAAAKIPEIDGIKDKVLEQIYEKYGYISFVQAYADGYVRDNISVDGINGAESYAVVIDLHIAKILLELSKREMDSGNISHDISYCLQEAQRLFSQDKTLQKDLIAECLQLQEELFRSVGASTLADLISGQKLFNQNPTMQCRMILPH
jgi:hypothetical protein